MCLHIDWRKTSIFLNPPLRRRAWKVVRAMDRAPKHQRRSKIRYLKGHTISVSLIAILKNRTDNTLSVGLHVFTKRPRWFGSDFRIIEVEVDPSDWVADGLWDDAVYRKLKVLT